jgi:hypothetical protein
MCAMAKQIATDNSFEVPLTPTSYSPVKPRWKVCDEALQLHGGYGYLKEYPIERYLRDVRHGRTLTLKPPANRDSAQGA